MTKRLADAEWCNNEETLRNDHCILITTVPLIRKNCYIKKIRLVNWDEFRKKRETTSTSEITSFDDWKRHSLKEEEATRLIQALIISRVTYSVPYLTLKPREQEKLEVLIRRSFKQALGLPPGAPSDAASYKGRLAMAVSVIDEDMWEVNTETVPTSLLLEADEAAMALAPRRGHLDAGSPAHVWLCVALPCLGKRASWWLSRARGSFGPFGAPRARQYATSAPASHRRESWGPPMSMAFVETQTSPEDLSSPLGSSYVRPKTVGNLPPSCYNEVAVPSKEGPTPSKELDVPSPAPADPSGRGRALLLRASGSSSMPGWSDSPLPA
ncbi:hypothetical protein HPB47_015935 [Ixodes persulcatus]|uniref:Uncharacterized protein n=1 Tax=Ixodes persulcatus TaxID=34615 RepID=A0AC60QS79_IXOPE|nr:hypothetical protein HPB47_015935 [Ixodes persulcatus]